MSCVAPGGRRRELVWRPINNINNSCSISSSNSSCSINSSNSSYSIDGSNSRCSINSSNSSYSIDSSNSSYSITSSNSSYYINSNSSFEDDGGNWSGGLDFGVTALSPKEVGRANQDRSRLYYYTVTIL